MPRPKKQQSSSSELSPGQASYVLARLVRERRISQGEVNRYVSDMGREIRDLEEQLRRLREAHGGGVQPSAARETATQAAAPAQKTRRRGRRRVSAKSAQGGSAATGSQTQTTAKAGRKRGRRSAVTSEQLASRQLQGKYLSLVRRFPERRRAEYARIARERGREAAIREMQNALNK